MHKQIPALLAALIITSIIGFGMFVIGSNAVTNKDSVAVQNSPSSSSPNANVSLVSPNQASQAQLQQLQNLVTQYQQREQQYQSELNAAQNKLDQANSTIQQYQQVITYLVRRGVIQVDQNGQILIP